MNYIRTKISLLRIESWTKSSMTLSSRHGIVYLDFSSLKIESSCDCRNYYCYHILFSLEKLNIPCHVHTKYIRKCLEVIGECKEYSMTNTECCVCTSVLKKKCISCMTCQNGVHQHCWDKFNRINNRLSLKQKKCFYCLGVRLIVVQGIESKTLIKSF